MYWLNVLQNPWIAIAVFLCWIFLIVLVAVNIQSYIEQRALKLESNSNKDKDNDTDKKTSD